MHKPAVWINIILIILLIVVLVLALVGCVDTHKKRWRDRVRIIVHDR